jgi:hypothetical protein
VRAAVRATESVVEPEALRPPAARTISDTPRRLASRQSAVTGIFLCAMSIRAIVARRSVVTDRFAGPLGRLIADSPFHVQGATTMRVMVIVKATASSEAGAMPDTELLAAMGKYNEELVKAGVMLAGEGLHPSSRGKRVHFSGKDRTVVDGPFAETKELIAGYWLWQVNSMEEAVEWVKRCPNPMPTESDIEIRPIFSPEDFGEAFTPELQEQEARLRAEMDRKHDA